MVRSGDQKLSPEEFAALPSAMALKLLAGHPSIAKYLATLDLPKVPRCPKYDLKIYRKGGYMWASETDLERLKFWRQRSLDSAAKGGQYADKDTKQAERLKYFIEFRTVESGAISLIRGDDMTDARAPAYKPRVIDSSYTQIKPQDQEGYGQGGADDDDIPF